MKRLAGLTALALVIGNTSGCGWLWGKDGYFRDRGTDYLDSRQTGPMKVPEGLQSKQLDPLLPIPMNIADSHEKAGEFEVPRPLPLANAGSSSDYSLQKSGDSRWLIAQRPPAEVWPVAHQFFQDNGFSFADERPQTGEFSTNWQPLTQLSAPLARRLGSRVAGVDPGSEARVRVRIEPGVQTNTSEVYVLSETRPAGSSASADWPSRPVVPALDAALLDEMLANMSTSAEKGGSVSLLAAHSTYDTPGWRRAQGRTQGGGGSGGYGGGFSEAGPGYDSGAGARRKGGPLLIEGELVAKSTGSDSAYQAGSRVFHVKFGNGTVAAVDGNKLTIDFDKAGRKMVLESFVSGA